MPQLYATFEKKKTQEWYISKSYTPHLPLFSLKTTSSKAIKLQRHGP